MDAVLTFQDSAEPLLSELRAYTAQYPETVLMSTESQPLPGLPLVSNRSERVVHNYRTYIQTPWGLAAPADIRYYQYPTLSYLGLYILSQPAPDTAVPASVLPEPATAVVQPLTGLAEVYLGDTLVPGTDPVWEGKLKLPDRWYDPQVLHLTRLELARAGIPLYPTTLFAHRVAYPWLTPEGLPAITPTIANGEVCLPLIGYAVDPDTNEVVYLNLVGHKTAARSIWGSLNTMHQRKLTLSAPGIRDAVISSHTYTTHTAIVDADTGLLRMQIVDRRVCSAEVTDRAYLVTPAGLDAAALDAAFAARLTAVLPVGIPAPWGAQLRQAGDDLGLVQACLSGGDVGTAYALTADEQWLEVLQDLLHSDPDFVIPAQLS